MMLNLAVGSIAFTLFFLYDLWQIKCLPSVFRICFVLGCLMLTYATAGLVLITPVSPYFSAIRLVFLIPAAIFLLLTIYALFFTLPSKKTYSDQNDRPVTDSGVYALCRHPGVIFLSLFYLFLLLSFCKVELLYCFVIWTLQDIVLVFVEDRFIFPKLFNGYEDYKTRVPFLIPTIDSLKRAVKR